MTSVQQLARTPGHRSLIWNMLNRVCPIELCDPVSDATLPCPQVSATENLVEVGIRARVWARTIGCRYDLFVGSGPAQLMAANVLACRLGRTVASTEYYLRGTAWLSSQVTERKTPGSILIIALHTPEEVLGAVEEILIRHPDARVDVGVLLPSGNRQPFCTTPDIVNHRQA